MSSLVVKGQAWAPTSCESCVLCCLRPPREENLTSFERRKREAASQALVVRSTWVCLHAFIICSLFVVDTRLSRALHLHHLLFLACYLVLAVANLALYINLCISNPGYLQPGVHALSLSTMKRDSEGSLAAEDAAELGIGGLAHIDAPLIGRRTALGSQRDHRSYVKAPGRNGLDRTTTLPNLPSQFTKEALLDVTSPSRNWDESPTCRARTFEGLLAPGSPLSAMETAEAAISEAKTESAAGILAPGDRAFASAISGELAASPAAQASKIRVRGSSLGCELELPGHKQDGPDWAERSGEEAHPLLSAEAHDDLPGGTDASTSGRRAEEPGVHCKPLKLPAPRHQRRRTGSWWEGPNPGRWCEYCGAWQLLRSRHCHDCGRCVRRFDHHCAWVGRCIGQDNHLTFWWYLVAQLALLSWTAHIILEGLEQPRPHTIARFVVLLACSIPTLLLTGFVAILLGYHTYLVLTAQTTHEMVQGSEGYVGAAKAPYLRHLPRGTRPFSLGPAQNVLHFCCDRAGTSYQLPAGLSARGPGYA